MAKFLTIFLIAFPMLFFQDSLLSADLEPLTLKKCIALAIKNNPSLKIARENIVLYELNVRSAKSNYLPQLDFSSGATQSTTKSYDVGVSLSQTLTDFGKTRANVKQAKFALEATHYDYQITLADLIFEVKESYYQLIKAQGKFQVAKESLEEREKYLQEAQAFYKAGKVSRIDLTAALVNVSEAKLDLATAENSQKKAYEDLRNVLGIKDNSLKEKKLSKEFTTSIPEIDSSEMIDKALKERTEMKRYQAQFLSLKQALKEAHAGYYPTLSASSSFGYSGETLSVNDKEWSVGVSLKVPIFDRWSTKIAIAEARCSIRNSEAEMDSARLDIIKEVENAISDLGESQEKMSLADTYLRQAKENYALALGRYKVGVGKPLEVRDAQLSLNKAKLNRLESLCDCEVALANFQKAIGFIEEEYRGEK